jgi:dTDP-4-amino-4,6-dideoxygalactose transaminase
LATPITERRFGAAPVPVANWLGRHSFVLPVNPALSTDDITDVGAAVGKVFVEVTR